MSQVKTRFSILPLAAALVLGGLSLTGCATPGYVDQKIADVNKRLDAVEAKVADVGQRADAANAAAQSAGSAAQAAQASAQQANQRLDQLTPRVDAIEQELAAKKKPRN
ncbi:MAG TPA: Lpp/OprI family alanine-zipper lipoprotein [Caulobacteraceae bacterium]|nr:Lpp/OprI family alanine-zipper lipoprotein [Caulobacteraceae bacterium]